MIKAAILSFFATFFGWVGVETYQASVEDNPSGFTMVGSANQGQTQHQFSVQYSHQEAVSVPEPASITLMVVGLGGVGVSRYLSKRSKK